MNAYALLTGLAVAPALVGAAAPSLIPSEPNQASPSYVCTWACQDWYAYNRLKGQGLSPRDTLNHEQLFGEKGWAKTFYPDLRGDLIYLLDDGWDLPKGKTDTFGSLEVHPSKFPGYGDTPAERLKTLVRNVKAAGWKGCGIWICANEKPGTKGPRLNEAYWRERLEWSRDGGTALPIVTQTNPDEPLPYVSVCRFPNGATAVGAYGRVSPEKGYRKARARVAAQAGRPEAPIGVFGVFDTLTLTFEAPVEGRTLWAQSLMGTAPAKDITQSVTLQGNTLTIPGALLEAIGTEGATEPFSEPAAVLSLR